MALEELAAAAPDWVAGVVTGEWAKRYGRPARYDRLARGADAQLDYALTIGGRRDDGAEGTVPDGHTAVTVPGRQVAVLRQI